MKDGKTGQAFGGLHVDVSTPPDPNPVRIADAQGAAPPPADDDVAIGDEVAKALDAEVEELDDDAREAAELAQRYASPPGQLNMNLIGDFCDALNRKDTAAATASGAATEASTLEPLMIAALEAAGCSRIAFGDRVIAPKHDVEVTYPRGKDALIPVLKAAVPGTPIVADGGETVMGKDGEPILVDGEPQTYQEGEQLLDENGDGMFYEGDDLSALVREKTEVAHATLKALVRECRDADPPRELPDAIRDLVGTSIKTSLSITKL